MTLCGTLTDVGGIKVGLKKERGVGGVGREECICLALSLNPIRG